MAYTPATLSLAWDLIGGKFDCWHYTNPDPIATVVGTDYFALVSPDRGVSEGDLIFVTEDDTDPHTTVLCYFSEIDAAGNGTVTAMAYAGAGSFTTLAASGNTALTGNLTVGGSALLGDAAADLIGFFGGTGITQRASSVMATTNLATSSDFGATQLACVQEIMNTLNLLKLHKGTA